MVRAPDSWLKGRGFESLQSGGRMLFSRVNFLYWLLFRYPFHPRVTPVARKRSGSFCQKYRWLVRANHACTLRMWLCMKWYGAWLYSVHRKRRNGCSLMWHQPCQRYKYTTSVDFFFFFFFFNRQKQILTRLVHAAFFARILRWTCAVDGALKSKNQLTESWPLGMK